ncbi:hypothetical protein ACQ86N_17870 [Puia sp. P3]|uniref:hypothetical protein n=1 Tax=Puia sp. P3 TaxID=3423952 RepID=UPI003D67D1D7
MGPNGDVTVPPQVLPAFSWQADFFRQLIATKFDGSGGTIDGYKNYYQSIVGCNIALQYADGSVGTQADKDFLKGQAFALRASLLSAARQSFMAGLIMTPAPARIRVPAYR